MAARLIAFKSGGAAAYILSAELAHANPICYMSPFEVFITMYYSVH